LRRLHSPYNPQGRAALLGNASLHGQQARIVSGLASRERRLALRAPRPACPLSRRVFALPGAILGRAECARKPPAYRRRLAIGRLPAKLTHTQRPARCPRYACRAPCDVHSCGSLLQTLGQAHVELAHEDSKRKSTQWVQHAQQRSRTRRTALRFGRGEQPSPGKCQREFESGLRISPCDGGSWTACVASCDRSCGDPCRSFSFPRGFLPKIANRPNG